MSRKTKPGAYHLELDFSSASSDETPVTVEFLDVKEVSKAEFISATIGEAKNYVSQKCYDDARVVIDFVLKFEPNNAEAKALINEMDEVIKKEKEESELRAQQEAEAQRIADEQAAKQKIADEQAEKQRIADEKAAEQKIVGKEVLLVSDS